MWEQPFCPSGVSHTVCFHGNEKGGVNCTTRTGTVVLYSFLGSESCFFPEAHLKVKLPLDSLSFLSFLESPQSEFVSKVGSCK